MVQVKCHCGRTATMSHPTDWVCQCKVEALYEEFEREIAAMRRQETENNTHVQMDAGVIPAAARLLEAS